MQCLPIVEEAMETVGVNVQFDESDDDGDNEDLYGEDRDTRDVSDDSGGESSEGEAEAARRAIQASAVSYLDVCCDQKRLYKLCGKDYIIQPV